MGRLPVLCGQKTTSTSAVLFEHHQYILRHHRPPEVVNCKQRIKLTHFILKASGVYLLVYYKFFFTISLSLKFVNFVQNCEDYCFRRFPLHQHRVLFIKLRNQRLHIFTFVQLIISLFHFAQNFVILFKI